MIRVVVADDHPVVRSGYLRLLDQAGGIRVVAEADDCDSALQAFVDHAPDVMVADLEMPGGGGIELIRRMLMRDANARVLVFSMHDSALLVRRSIDAGARGFLSKVSEPDSLVAAVRAVEAGRRYIGADIAPDTMLTDTALEAQRLAALSPREFEVFRLLAQGHSINECAAALSLSPKTLSNHQTAIKEKLGVATSAALVHLAMRHGVISTSGV